MQFTTLLSALALASTAVANFHIVHGVDGYHNNVRDYFTMAIPSNEYSCRTVWQGNDHDRRANIRDIDDWRENVNAFGVDAGLCGQPRLDFHKQGDQWAVYQAGGDGRELARCYNNRGSERSCGQEENQDGRGNWGWFYSRVVCYGSC